MIISALEIKKFLESNNLKQKDFASKIGAHYNTVGNWLKGGKIDQTTSDRIVRFIERYRRDISENYSTLSNAKDLGPLQGDFETHQTKSGNTYQIVGDGNYRFEVKVVEQLAYAGYLAGWADAEYIESLPSTVITVKKFHTGTYRVFEVKGDSMDCDRKYAIENGDCVIGHKVERDLWNYKLHIKDWAEWVIVSDEGIIIKHILHHDVENKVLICRSYNEDKDMYPDFELSLDSVYELYNVVKVEKSRLG